MLQFHLSNHACGNAVVRIAFGPEGNIRGTQRSTIDVIDRDNGWFMLDDGTPRRYDVNGNEIDPKPHGASVVMSAATLEVHLKDNGIGYNVVPIGPH